MPRTPTAHRPPPPGTRGRDPALRSHDGALELPPTHDTAPKLSGRGRPPPPKRGKARTPHSASGFRAAWDAREPVGATAGTWA